MEKMTAQEKEAMLALWQIGEGTAREILGAHAAPAPHYNTLRSTLDKLKEKKYLDIKPVGNTNIYLPLVQQDQYKKQALSELVKHHFENSYKDLVAFFASEKKLSRKDLEDILDIIKNKKTRS